MTNLTRELTSEELQFNFDPDDLDFQNSDSTTSSILKQNLYERRNKTYAQLNQALGPNQPQLKVDIGAPPVLSAWTAAASKENQELQKTTLTNQSPKAALVFRAPPTKSPSPIEPNSTTSNQSPKVVIGFRAPPTKSPSPLLSRQTTVTSPTTVIRTQSPFLAFQSISNIPAVSKSGPAFQSSPIVAGRSQVTNSHLVKKSIFAAPSLPPEIKPNRNQLNESSICQPSSSDSILDELDIFPFSF